MDPTEENDAAPTEEDTSFFANVLGDAAFLTRMELPDNKTWINPRKSKRKRDVEITAIQRAESTFEHAPRSAPQGRRQPSTTSGPSASFNGRTAADDNQDDDDARATARLPIKMGKRLAKAPKRRIQDDATSTQAPKGGGRGGSTSKETVGAGAAETTATGAHGAHGADGSVAAEGTKLSGDALLRATKLEIATLASDILHDPDNSMQKLRKLRELCSHNDESVGPSICKLAILSLATVFKDIIPGYRIRELSDMEKSSAVSAAVKKTRDYDQSLLRNYQMFLKRLHAVVKKASDKDADRHAKSMMAVSIRGMCLLLTAVPHFNFRSNMIELLVPRMNDRENEKLADHCCTTVKSLFAHDKQFDATQETVKAMSRVIRASNYRVRSEMLRCFFDLKLSAAAIKSYQQQQLKDRAADAADSKEAAKVKPGKGGKHKSRMKKRVNKAHKELDKELRDAQLEVDTQALARRQTAILNQVFATYFRVLKHGRQSPLLPLVLQGLARHTHLIDASFFGDLMKVLHEIMRDPTLGMDVSLGCVRTGCLLLSGQTGMALNIDVKAFHDMLFSILLELDDNDETISVALMCVRLLMHERREVSLERVAAFVRRLCEASLRMRPHQAVAALFNVRALFHKYPKLAPMLDGDAMTTTSYRPDVAEPEHSNALGSPMWEVTLLDQHYYPWVQSYAKHIAQGAPSTGPHSLNAKHARAQPHEIFEALDCSQHGFSFNPAMQKPKPHALFKAGDTGRKRRIGLLNPRVVGPSTVAAGVVRSGAAKKAAKGFKAFFVDTKEAIEVEGLEDQLSALQMIQSESVMFRERTAAAERNTARQKAEAKNLKATAAKSAVPATAKVSQPAGKTLPTKKKKKKKAKANKVQVTA